MIVQLRVDDRLVHGQVTLMWGKELSTKGILVANDAAAQNETQSSTLKMACPSGQKLLIRTIDDAIKIANDPRAGEMRIFALTGNIADALKLVKGAPGRIGSVNVANVGRFDRSDDAAKVLLTTGVRSIQTRWLQRASCVSKICRCFIRSALQTVRSRFPTCWQSSKEGLIC